MTSDDLDTPLGQTKRKEPSKLRAAVPRILAGLLGLFGIAVVAWAIFVNDPLGGEPTAVVATGSITKPPAKPGAERAQHSRSDEPVPPAKAPPAIVAMPAAVAPPPGSKTITIIDGSSGKRQDVIIPGQSSGKAQKPPID